MAEFAGGKCNFIFFDYKLFKMRLFQTGSLKFKTIFRLAF